MYKSHRLLLNVHSDRKIQFSMGPQRKRELVDQRIMFVPYYFAAPQWQAFFINKSRVAELRMKAQGRAVSLPNDFATSFQELWTLFHQSRLSEWPADAEAYKLTLDMAMEIFLDRIRAWASSSFASLS